MFTLKSDWKVRITDRNVEWITRRTCEHTWNRNPSGYQGQRRNNKRRESENLNHPFDSSQGITTEIHSSIQPGLKIAGTPRRDTHREYIYLCQSRLVLSFPHPDWPSRHRQIEHLEHRPPNRSHNPCRIGWLGLAGEPFDLNNFRLKACTPKQKCKINEEVLKKRKEAMSLKFGVRQS